MGADGSSFAIVDVDNATSVREAVTPDAPFFDVTFVPIVEATAAVPIAQRAMAWADSVH